MSGVASHTMHTAIILCLNFLGLKFGQFCRCGGCTKFILQIFFNPHPCIYTGRENGVFIQRAIYLLWYNYSEIAAKRTVLGIGDLKIITTSSTTFHMCTCIYTSTCTCKSIYTSLVQNYIIFNVSQSALSTTATCMPPRMQCNSYCTQYFFPEA